MAGSARFARPLRPDADQATLRRRPIFAAEGMSAIPTDPLSSRRHRGVRPGSRRHPGQSPDRAGRPATGRSRSRPASDVRQGRTRARRRRNRRSARTNTRGHQRRFNVVTRSSVQLVMVTSFTQRRQGRAAGDAAIGRPERRLRRPAPGAARRATGGPPPHPARPDRPRGGRRRRGSTHSGRAERPPQRR